MNRELERGKAPSRATVASPEGYELPDSQRRALRWTVYVGYFALVAGIFHGFSQALSYAGIDILPYFPALKSYYQGLTAHGVANALFFTFSFSNAFLPLMTARALARPLVGSLLWASFGTLVLANLMVIYAVTTNQASVLYTSYAPLQAHWSYYAGLVLLVVSTWLALANMAVALRGWRREHPGARIPLLAFASVVSYLMWFLASLPIATEFLGFLLPWSLGWMEKTDPLLDRTLFWFTGHPIVYAWLLPTYVSWYLLVPRQAGGRVLSDSLTRGVFILFLVLSIPTGFHHQYSDPGISEAMKGVHTVLTFGVFFPSLATAFSVGAALELGGRARGGKGLFSWVTRLPWGDPSLTAQVLAMFTFVFGGITGLINASSVMNAMIHNTTWVPGHFHMTVGSAVALSLMGIAYWLIPYLTKRGLRWRGLALASSLSYAVGVMIFARGMISTGLAGMPRRTFMAQATYHLDAWDFGGKLTAVGGTIMFLGVMMFFAVVLATVFTGKRGAGPVDIPWSESVTEPAPSGLATWPDRLGFWVVVTVVLVALAYGPWFVTYLPPNFVSPGYKLW